MSSAEILAIHVRNNKDITGIKFQDIHKGINLLADDVLFFIKGDNNVLISLCDTLKKFATNSDLTVNFDKSTSSQPMLMHGAVTQECGSLLPGNTV